MNNFRRSVEEIVQVVKIADTTLKKRLDEFKATPSGSLTLADFRNVWLDDEMDPPAFTKGREREEAEKEEKERAAIEEMEGVEGAVEGWEGKRQGKDKGKGKEKERGKKGAKRKKKRKRGEESEEDEDMNEEDPAVKNGFHPCPAIDPTLLNQGILEGTMQPLPLFMPDPGGDDPNFNIDPALLHHAQELMAIQAPAAPSGHTLSQTHPSTPAVEETVSTVLAEEVSIFLQNTQGTMLSEALDEAEQRRLAQILVDDELIGLDEDELDRFLLSEEEVKIKERVWVELNKDYLEAIAGEVPLDASFTV
jgi:transcription factor IIIB subunit 2